MWLQNMSYIRIRQGVCCHGNVMLMTYLLMSHDVMDLRQTMTVDTHVFHLSSQLLKLSHQWMIFSSQTTLQFVFTLYSVHVLLRMRSNTTQSGRQPRCPTHGRAGGSAAPQWGLDIISDSIFYATQVNLQVLYKLEAFYHKGHKIG